MSETVTEIEKVIDEVKTDVEKVVPTISQDVRLAMAIAHRDFLDAKTAIKDLEQKAGEAEKRLTLLAENTFKGLGLKMEDWIFDLKDFTLAAKKAL